MRLLPRRSGTVPDEPEDRGADGAGAVDLQDDAPVPGGVEAPDDVGAPADEELTVELRRAADGSGLVDDSDAPEETGSTAVPQGGGGATAVDPARSARAARRRFVRRRWARRWLAWRRLLAVLVAVAVVAGSGWLVFGSSVLATSGVRVEGTSVLPPASVRRAADVPVGTPLATVDLDAVAARVEKLPAVASVDVSRAWPDRVRIDVTERRVVAVVAPTAPGGRFRGTDAEGVVFRSYAKRPAGVPLIRTDEGTGSDALAEAASVAGSLPAGIAARVAQVSVQSVDTIDLDLRNGRIVRWGSADDSSDKARVLTVLLDQKASFYDVSVPGQPILRR